VCFCGDYYGSKAINYDKLIRKHKIDIVIQSSPDFLEDWVSRKPEGVEGYCLPYIYAVDVNRYENLGGERDVDVMCVYGLFNAIYPKRPELQNIVSKMPYNTVIGNWKVGNYKKHNYVKLLNRSKIFVSVNGVHNQITMKYTEAMACGTLFLTDEPKHLDFWGIKDGEHLVCYNNFEDMRAKVDYYLQNEDERQRITENAYELVRGQYTAERWVRVWSQIVQERLSWSFRQKYTPGLKS
jgi:hypothetical protein